MSTAANKAATRVQRDAEKLAMDLRDLVNAQELDVLPEIKALRARVEERLGALRESAADVVDNATAHARDAATAADEYAHEEPWRVAGIALAVGAVFGFLLSRR